jgi:putative copper resistance protein D
MIAFALIFMRAVHFGATLSAAGAVFFLAFVGEPAFRRADDGGAISALVRWRLARVAWTSLVLMVVTGAAWLVLQAEKLSDLPLTAVFSQGVVWSVLSDTDFGHDWSARLILTVLFAALLLTFGTGARRPAPWNGTSAVLLAAGLVGSLAFAGHAAAGSGIGGTIHLASDILHLVAAAAWVGALVPLAMLLGAAKRAKQSIEIAGEAAVRFSTLGIISVGVLIATGIVNTWVLAGSIAALVGTDYGRLLLAKVALFGVMLGIAGVNRLRLTPRLVQVPGVGAAGGVGGEGGAGGMAMAADALLQLRRNCLIEAAIGAVIIVIVGVLGTLPPGLDE